MTDWDGPAEDLQRDDDDAFATRARYVALCAVLAFIVIGAGVLALGRLG